MNLRKLNLGLVALLLGFGLVVTQSAFTPKQNVNAIEYGYLDGQWVDVNSTPPTGQEYSCDDTLEQVCTYMFEGDPNDPLNPESGIPTARIGEFKLVDAK